MIEQLFTRKTFTTRNNVQICADPEVFVYEGRVERYVQVMDSGVVFASHVKKASIRSVRKTDALRYSRHPNIPVLEVVTDHQNETVLLAISGHMDEYDEAPHWELKILNRAGTLMYHVADKADALVDLFKNIVIHGGAAATNVDSIRKPFIFGFTL